MEIKIRKISDKARTPLRATKGSAGADLFACLEKDTVIKPGERVLIPTGIAVQPESAECAGFVFPRSSVSSKYGITLANCVGVIDSDYTGEIKVPLINLSDAPYTVHDGDRIAQLVFMPVILPVFTDSESFEDTERGVGGFGSTGK